MIPGIKAWGGVVEELRCDCVEKTRELKDLPCLHGLYFPMEGKGPDDIGSGSC
jgi:hypothetical protein